MKKRKNRLGTVFTPCLQFVCITSLLVIMISYIVGIKVGFSSVNINKIIFWNVEYLFVLALCMEKLSWGGELKRDGLYKTCILYALSFGAVWFSSKFQVLNFWMFGVLILGFLVPAELAIALHILLTMTFCTINGHSVDTFICYFTFGTLILLLEDFVDQLKNTVLIFVISITTNIAFLILNHNFELDFTANVIYQLISTGIMILGLWGLKVTVFGQTENDELNKELMNRLEAYSETIYEHCLDVGNISAIAAEQIHVKRNVAYLGGCYHEIGRIMGKDYISHGVELLKEYGISKEVIAVVREHNIHCEKPASKEAAIVMLSDSILSTIRYLREKEPNTKITIEVLTKAIMNKRNAMGLFEQSGLSEGEIQTLQSFYIETLKEN